MSAEIEKEVELLRHQKKMKPRRNVCCQPWIHDSRFDFWVKPLGLLYLAGLLRENGYSVRLIDCLDPGIPHNSYRKARPPKRKPFGQGKFARQVIPSPNLCANPRSYHGMGFRRRSFGRAQERRKTGRRPRHGMMTYWFPAVVRAIRMISLRFPDTPVILGETT